MFKGRNIQELSVGDTSVGGHINSVVKLVPVAGLAFKAALWVRIQIYYKSEKGVCKNPEEATFSSPHKEIIKSLQPS